MYIMTKLLSVASPEKKRQNENTSIVVANIVNILPAIAIMLDIIKIGNLPI